MRSDGKLVGQHPMGFTIREPRSWSRVWEISMQAGWRSINLYPQFHPMLAKLSSQPCWLSQMRSFRWEISNWVTWHAYRYQIHLNRAQWWPRVKITRRISTLSIQGRFITPGFKIEINLDTLVQEVLKIQWLSNLIKANYYDKKSSGMEHSLWCKVIYLTINLNLKIWL